MGWVEIDGQMADPNVLLHDRHGEISSVTKKNHALPAAV
jgi:hypothetical protein